MKCGLCRDVTALGDSFGHFVSAVPEAVPGSAHQLSHNRGNWRVSLALNKTNHLMRRRALLSDSHGRLSSIVQIEGVH